MTLSPSAANLRARARADLRTGGAVVIAGTPDLLVFAAETLRARQIEEARAVGSPFVAISQYRATALGIACGEGQVVRIPLPPGGDIAWVRALADPGCDAAAVPEHPPGVIPGGDGADDAMARASLVLCREAQLLPATLCVPLAAGEKLAREHALTRIQPATPDADGATLHEVVSARVPLEVSDMGRLHVFRPDDGGEEHYAISIGELSKDQPVLCRVHSACVTGDLMGSLKCDCGPQLKSALAAMGQAGAGVLIYLNQEGRGIGLSNKMRAYQLQDQGFDTVEANHRLGFRDDERDFSLSAKILSQLGFSQVRLLTNNPAKIARLEACGIEVTQRIPVRIDPGEHNRSYLATKADKSGHIL